MHRPAASSLSLPQPCLPVPNKAELQQFFQIITERLQRLYDLA